MQFKKWMAPFNFEKFKRSIQWTFYFLASIIDKFITITMADIMIIIRDIVDIANSCMGTVFTINRDSHSWLFSLWYKSTTATYATSQEYSVGKGKGVVMDKDKGVVIRLKVGDETYVVNKKRKEFDGQYGVNGIKSQKESIDETKKKDDDRKGDD
eukprot:279106_1